MKYKLLMHKDASKFYDKCTQNQKDIFDEKIALLKESPLKHEQLDIKKLGGYKELYRLKVGGYRLIYAVRNNELLIFMLLIGNRGDVYKKLN